MDTANKSSPRSSVVYTGRIRAELQSLVTIFRDLVAAILGAAGGGFA